MLERTADIKQRKEDIGTRQNKMTTALEKDTVCPHCGAEPFDDDDLCRFCGKVMVPMGSVQSASTLKMVKAGLRSLKKNIRPLTKDEFHYWDTLDLSDPSDPIWDD